MIGWACYKCESRDKIRFKMEKGDNRNVKGNESKTKHNHTNHNEDLRVEYIKEKKEMDREETRKWQEEEDKKPVPEEKSVGDLLREEELKKGHHKQKPMFNSSN